MNQLLRELVYLNNLKRSMSGSETKESFDYQWRRLPEGTGMPSDAVFFDQIPQMILERTDLSKGWFAGKRVLDAGCGTGRWTHGLVTLGARVTAVEQSEAGLREAKSLVGDTDNVQWLQRDLLDLDLAAHSFDLVWCFGVAHHTENPIRVMKNLIQTVAPGGYLFMMLYGYPGDASGFEVQADYEGWRRRLAPLPFAEKAGLLKQRYPPDMVHGYFDAVSPPINDLFTWEWIQGFLQQEGFDSIHRTIDHGHHHFVARMKGGSV